MDDEPYNILALKIVMQACFDSERELWQHVEQLIDQASNGQEAVDMVKDCYRRDNSYALIFMDCSMPIMDGFESSKCIRSFVSNLATVGSRPP